MMPKGRKVMIKKKKPASNVQLERVIGITSKGNNSIAVSPQTGEIAYVASGVIVFFNVQTNKQESHIFNQNSRVFSCLAFGSNGRYLATGEGTCKQPEIIIWELSAQKQYTPIKTLKGHKYGIEWVAFSPDGNSLVSVGSEHDGGLFVWDWRTEYRLTSNKITKRILSLAFAPSGEFFVTGGVKSIKLWSFDRAGKPIATASSENAEIKCMMSKNFDLAEMKDKSFASVAVNGANIFALTLDGILCVFTMERIMDKWMDLHAGGGYALHTDGNLLACGCAEGIIRCFDASSLEHIITLPRPPPLGQANISPDRKKQVISTDANSSFADTVALLLFDNNMNLYSLYSDRTVFVWNISKLDSVSVFRSFLHHSGSINDIQIMPSSTFELTQFITGSSDKTIRFWHLCHVDPKKLEGSIIKNVYSKDLSRIIYVSKSVNHFKAKNSQQPEDEGSIKCVKCSPDMKSLASGDTVGMLRIYDTNDLSELLCMQAHDTDIMAIDYSGFEPSEGKSDTKGKALLATGSRDRLIHLFSVDEGYKPITTIDDHSSSISDLCLIRVDGNDKLVSCGSDKALIFRSIQATNINRDYQNLQKQKKLYSIKPHPIHKTVITGEDKAIKIWSLDNGKMLKEFEDYQEKGVKSPADSNIKLAMDRSGMIIAACNQDKYVRLIDYYSGKLLGKMNVGELPTAAAFTPNGRKVLVTTSDGCIFILKLSTELANAIRARQSANFPMVKNNDIVFQSDLIDNEESKNEPEEAKEAVKPREEPKAMKIHESLMPDWAKSQLPKQPEKRNKSPFDLAKDPEKPIPGAWGKNPVKFGLDEIAPLRDDPIIKDPKLIEFQFQEVDSEDDGKKEEKKEEEPEVVITTVAAAREEFTVTKSVVLPGGFKETKDEEIKEETEVYYDAEELLQPPEEIPDFEPESNAPAANPLRKSLSSSFWQQKQEKVVEQPLYFQYEPVETEPWHVPKIGVLNKEKQEDLKPKIDDVKKRLQDMGILGEGKWNRKKKPNDIKPEETEEIHEEIKEQPEISVEKPIEKLEEIPIEIEGEEKKSKKEKSHRGKHKKKREKKNELAESSISESTQNHFNSPYVQEAHDQSSVIASTCDFQLSQSSMNQSFKLSKQHYIQGFKDLKSSLLDVKTFFDQTNPADPEYSMSLEESSQDIIEIQELLRSISESLGGSLQASQETNILERYSEKLLTIIEQKIKRRVPEY